MADNSDNGFLYFMVGALAIGMFIGGYLYLNGMPQGSTNNTTLIEKTTTERVPSAPNITINPPAAPTNPDKN